MVFETNLFWLCRAKYRLLAPQLAPVQRRYYLRVGWLNGGGWNEGGWNGGGEIRTPGTPIRRTTLFESAAFNHSATPPGARRHAQG
jgi:hypothetical protein